MKWDDPPITHHPPLRACGLLLSTPNKLLLAPPVDENGFTYQDIRGTSFALVCTRMQGSDFFLLKID